MSTLEFVRIDKEEKDSFLPQFQTYLEEIDLISGRSVNPDFQSRFPEYNRYFMNDPNWIPFRIFHTEPDSEGNMERINVGFFFMRLITPKDFPEDVPRLIKDENAKVAWLTDFYIFPKYRGKGLAWEFFYSIIELARDPMNNWDVAWEVDVNNKPAIAFYEKVLQRIHHEFEFQFLKTRYTKKENGQHDYYFYQVEFHE